MCQPTVSRLAFYITFKLSYVALSVVYVRTYFQRPSGVQLWRDTYLIRFIASGNLHLEVKLIFQQLIPGAILFNRYGVSRVHIRRLGGHGGGKMDTSKHVSCNTCAGLV
ncbi:MAG: hypothetical protein GKR92_08880 [Gammaproteobacteria bacterium]|nr:MAG: hypothetical protein GKR92_08880 [Gammaproteobacteria bacterium]